MKKLLCFVILLKFCLMTWPVMADTNINGRWLDYYEEGDSYRIDKGVSVTTRAGEQRAGAYLKTGLWKWDFSDSILTFRVKVSNWRDVHTLILVVGSSGLKFEKSATFNIKQRLIGSSNNEWIEVAVPQSAWIVDGDIDWKNVNSVLVAVSDIGYKRITAEVANVKLTKASKVSQPTISITFDDGMIDTAKGVSIMEKYQLVGTAFVDPEFLDSPGYLTIDETVNLVFKGWDIGGHRIGNLAKLSSVELALHAASTADFLKSIASTGSNLYALPNGIRSSEILSELHNHFDFIFNINGMANDQTVFLTSSINRHSIDKHTSLALAKKWVDDCEKYNEWTIINFHTFSDTWEKEEDWSEEDFTSLLDYIKSKNIRVLPVSAIVRNIDTRH